MKRGIGIAVLLCLLFFSACGSAANVSRREEAPLSAGEEDKMEKSVRLLVEAAGINENGARGAAERLEELGIAPLVSAELLSAERGYTVRVEAEDGQVCCLGFGALGYLDLIRKDAPDGEILFAPID